MTCHNPHTHACTHATHTHTQHTHTTHTHNTQTHNTHTQHTHTHTHTHVVFPTYVDLLKFPPMLRCLREGLSEAALTYSVMASSSRPQEEMFRAVRHLVEEMWRPRAYSSWVWARSLRLRLRDTLWTFGFASSPSSTALKGQVSIDGRVHKSLLGFTGNGGGTRVYWGLLGKVDAQE